MMKHPNHEALIALANDKDAELRGYLYGLQAAGNLRPRINFYKEGANVLNDLREQIDRLRENAVASQKPKEKVVRWQWIVKYAQRQTPALMGSFYTEKEIDKEIAAGMHGACTKLKKAEWTRTEFDE